MSILFVFQLIGCIIIGYMAWVLATSVTVSRFLDGSLVRPSSNFSYIFVTAKQCKKCRDNASLS